MAELSLLFWNVAGKDRRERVARLVRTRGADVVILAENGTPVGELVAALDAGGGPCHFAPEVGARVLVTSRLPAGGLEEVASLPIEYATFRRVTPPEADELLLVGVHLPSQLYWGRDDQTLFCTRLADRVRAAETRVGHRR